MTTRKPRGLDDEKPKKKRTTKKRTAKKAPAPVGIASSAPMTSLPVLGPAMWRFVVFTDLHVGTKTIDRSLALLARVRDIAKHYDRQVVCLGDFWDQRASLSVRHLDLVQRELERWHEEGVHLVIVPGNHDQVTMDGSVNAVRIFDAFPHVTVATEPFIDPEKRLAFIPWREEEGEQEKTFAALSEDEWTIFAHAEVEDAVANSGKKAPGRVKLATIESRARACYLGHYHKRQRLGDRTWYIGSPFEMNFGEREDPHGVAIIDSENIEPAFIDLVDFPKHYRFVWPEDAARMSEAREQDIVEVYMTPDDLRGAALSSALQELKARDVRPLPLAPEKGDSAPTIALTLGEATKLYVEEWAKAQAALGAPVDDERMQHLISLGRHYLAQVPDARSIAPLSPVVRILGVEIENFCAVRGRLTLDLQNLGPVLLRGPMGEGKTSICDAITWALYGATTPRKPGERGGTLRADDVIHDAANETRCAVRVEIQDKPSIVIERTKKRGQGAKIRLYNADGLAAGISDTQEIIHRIVGLDLDLWRAYVYLGQGAVANFVTDADKKRKELLSRAFGLSACEPALKLVRDDLKKAESDVALYTMRETEARSALTTLETVDFTMQAEQWEEQKQAALVSFAQAAHAAKQQIEQIDSHLGQEAEWIARRDAYAVHIDGLTKSLAASSSDSTVTKLSTDLGASEAELGILHRELAQLIAKHKQMMEARDAGQTLFCSACGQPLPGDDLDAHLDDHEQQIESKQREVKSMEARVLNLRAQIDALKMGPAPDKEEQLRQLQEARDAHAKCVEAINTFARLKDARAAALQRMQEAQTQYHAKNAEVNPFIAKAQEVEEQKQRYSAALEEAKAKLAEAFRRRDDLMVWSEGFSAKGLPVLVLRTVLYELELHANAYLASLLHGRIHTRLVMDGDDLVIQFFEFDADRGTHVERSFYQLSGGQRRCIELAFTPFALSEMISSRCGVRVRMLIVDELTTHLDPDTKPVVCNLLRGLDRESVLVIDHDAGVQGEFDTVFDVKRANDGKLTVTRAA